MQSLLKFNLNGGLKRMVSTLICLMMVLATFPLHTLQSTVRADAGAPINLTLGDEKDTDATVGNGSEVKSWMNAETSGALANVEEVKSAGDINITLSDNITVTDEANKMDSSSNRFFYFTDTRFAGKTITIDGGSHTIKIDNASLCFLKLKDCRVILKNITIDGNSTGRGNSFIYVSKPSSGSESELEIEEGTTIQNCKNLSGHGGGIYNYYGRVTMNGGSIISCSARDNGGGIYNYYGRVTMNGGSITSCSACDNGGGIYNYYGRVTMNGGTISGCSSPAGGGIYNNNGRVTMNGGTISGCSSPAGGGIYNCNGGTVTMNGGTISGCSSSSPFSPSYGGGIYNSSGTVTMNAGSITGCSAKTESDAIYNGGVLNLPPKEFGFLTITLPAEHGEGSCTHNDNPKDVMGYEGIKGTVTKNPNRKIVFVDSKSGATVGFAYGKVDDKGLGDDVCVPTRPGYQITGMSCSKGGGGVVTVSVTYDKLYTVQYICDNKVVGVKSSCSENTTFSDIINTDFSKISLDGDQKLKDVVKPAAGYKFSNFTYGKENKEVVLSGGALTNWKDLTDSSFNGMVTVFLNYIDTASDTVKYVASGGHMVLDKKSKMTNYSGVNLPIGGLRKVHEPKKVIFDFCGQTIHHNDPNVPFIQGVPGKHIVICNLNMDGGGCK